MKLRHIKPLPHTLSICISLATLAGIGTGWADLKHRYAFDEAPGTTIAGDVYSGADGVLVNADFTGDGGLILNGSNAYVNLPNGIVSALNNATFEAWVTWSGAGNAWQRIFDLGSSVEGEDLVGTGSAYIFLTPNSSAGTTRFGARRTGETADNVILDGAKLASNVMTHVAVTYNAELSMAKLYINGQFVAVQPATQPLSSINDVNNWLGRSQYSGDAYLNATLHEFRIYDHVLRAGDVAISAIEGPDIDSSYPGALTAVHLTAGPQIFSWGTQQASVLADYEAAGVTSVNVTYGEGVVYESSDTNVAIIDVNGKIQAFASGTATITVTLEGISDSQTIEVIYPYANTLKHRYSFNESAGPTIVDSMGGADGTLVDPGARCTFTGSSLVLSNPASLASSSTTGSFVDLPNGIISSLTNGTFETWVTFVPVAGSWVRVFDFGNSSAGEGSPGTGLTYIFLNARTGTGGGSRFAIKNGSTETAVLDAAQLPNNVQSHVVVTYSTNLGTRMYINGTLVAAKSAVTPLSTLVDVNNWLGRAQYGGDSYINAHYNEFRIYEGLMSDGDVKASYAAGPDTVTNAGQLSSITLELSSPMSGGAQQAKVFAHYPNITNVDVTLAPDIALASSDPAILVVAAGGIVQSVAPGSATITATFQGLSASQVVTVVANAGVTNLIVNRYSFSEGAGTAITDSIGGANGTIINPVNAVWTGTNLWLNNPANSNATNAYVNLPNGIISRHTNATVEMWVTWSGNFSANWQRFFDFGSSDQGEDLTGTGRTYFLLTPRSGGTGNRMRVTMSTNANVSGAERVMEPTFTMAQSVETHIAIIYNSVGRAMSLYVNGVRVAAAVSEWPLRGLRDFNNWLGRAQYNDPFLNGQFNEFRIFSDCLTEQQIAASYAAGPDASFDIPVSIVTQPRSVTVGEGADATFSLATKGYPAVSYQWYRDASLLAGATSATLTLTGVTLADSGAQFTCVASNYVNGTPSVLTSGAATLTVINAASSLTHRYSFTSDASDNIGTAHGTLMNGAFVSDGRAQFVAANTNYVELPGHLIDGYTALTMEFWIDVGVNGNWSRIYDFGDQNPGGLGRNYILFTPHSGAGDTRMSYSDVDPGYNHEVVASTPGVLDNLGPTHVACVYDPANSRLALYTNGALAAVRNDFVFPLSSLINNYSWLGRSLYNGDSWYNGSIDEFRIYNSALSAAKVQASYLQGPNLQLNNDPVTIAQQPQDVRVAAGGNASFSVTAVGALHQAPLTYQWRQDGGNLTNATNATLSLTGVQVANVGNYDVVVSNQGGAVTSTVARLTLNVPPSAADDQVFTATNTVISFAAATLLANDTDAEGDALTVTAVSATSTNGGTVALASGVITYTPPADYTGTDAFTYTLTDALGDTATGTVVVQILAIAPGGTGVSAVPADGTAVVTFTGIPGVTYTIERSLAVPGGWTAIGTVTADATGLILFTDPNPPTGQAFYRTLKP